jgi:hypothetical protein
LKLNSERDYAPIRIKNSRINLSKEKNKNIFVEGIMSKAFTKEQILHMGEKDPHGRISIVRGNDQFIIDVSSYAGAPQYPHAYPGCEKTYDEKVSYKKIEGKECRIIKLTSKLEPSELYFQTYCENSQELKINFAPDNEANIQEADSNTKDCVHCR